MDQWGKIARRFDQWDSPLRPCPEDVELFRRSLGKERGKTLLLGVTPELQPLADLAVDQNPWMIEKFKGDALLGDWGALPFESEFDAMIGDGCLTVFQGDPSLFFEQVKKGLRKGGRLILRLFISPKPKESLEEVFEKREGSGFHAFKWKVAQAMANPYVRVRDLYNRIAPVWNHPTLEVYRESNLVYYFPQLSELPRWDQIEFPSSYELAERCPVVTWRFNQ